MRFYLSVGISDSFDTVFVQKSIISELVSFLGMIMISSVDFYTQFELMTIKIKNIMSYWFLSESSVSCFVFIEYAMSDQTFCFCHRLAINLGERFEFSVVGGRIFLHHSMVNIKSLCLLIMKSPWSIDHPPLRKGGHMRLDIKGGVMLLL